MTDKTDDPTDSPDSRVKVENIAAPEQELSPEEMDEVRGGDYVQGVYRDVLGRQPTPGTLNVVTGLSGGGSTSGDRTAEGSSRSDEVNDMYNTLLNRPGDRKP